MLWIYVNDKDVGKERAATDVQGSESFRISELQVYNSCTVMDFSSSCRNRGKYAHSGVCTQ